MSTRAENEALYTALERAIGEQPAKTLMERLPRHDNLATKTDLASMRTEFQARFDRLEGRLDTLEGRFDTLEGRYGKLEERFDTLDGTLHSYARTFVMVHTATVLAVAGLVLGVTQLT